VQKGHSPGNSKSQFESLHIVDDQSSGFFVQEAEEGAVGQPLADHDQPWRGVAAAKHGQHIWVRKYPENIRRIIIFETEGKEKLIVQ
jgi:hypothetical protein